MKNINLQITIDTQAIAGASPSPSRFQHKPTRISADTQFIVATGTEVASGQGCADIAFAAAVGDQIMLQALSGSYNFDDAVLLYALKHADGELLFGPFTGQLYKTSSVTPSSSATVLPARIVDAEFWFFQAGVRAGGSAVYELQFGLWTRNPSTGELELFGYFEWSSQITVVIPSD